MHQTDNTKIKKFNLLLSQLMIFLFYQSITYGQLSNNNTLEVIRDLKTFKKSISGRQQKQMVDLKTNISALRFDLRYATARNFTGKILYPPLNSSFLRKVVADSLQNVQIELNKAGLGLKIFDAYRPYSVTEKMWQIVPDERYAANPKNGSGHNRGIAVDVTLINLSDNQALDMGTDFDNFSDTAHHNYTNLPESILQNRLLLKTIMEKHGFKALPTEWWHYYLPLAGEFELLDLNFADLKKINSKNN